MSAPIVRQLELGPMENFIYIIGNPDTREGVIVDPAWDVSAILKSVGELKLKIVGALLTHTHADHCNGVADLVEETDCKVYVHEQEVGRLPDLKENLVRTQHGHRLDLGTLSIDFIHTPGHTPGSQCFHIQNTLVSGDTLFIDHCGRCDFPESDPEKMYESLHKTLSGFTDETTLLPGHNYADRAKITQTTLGDERIHNRYLLCQNLQDFLKIRMG